MPIRRRSPAVRARRPGTVTIDLTGKLGTAQLSDVLLTGAVAGVPVGAGVGATVSLALHVTVAIFDDPRRAAPPPTPSGLVDTLRPCRR